jgi:PAS domain S-box-containing protein
MAKDKKTRNPGSMESLYRMIVETMREAAFTVSFDGKVLFCNSRLDEILGKPPGEIVGRPLYEFVERDLWDEVEEVFALVPEGAVRRLLHFVNAEGCPVPVLVSAGILERPEGRCICMVATDLTVLEESEKQRYALQNQREKIFHQREQLQSILQNLPVGVMIAEAPSGRILMSNDRVSEIWGQELPPARNVEEYDIYEGFHADGRPYSSDDWPLARSIRSGEQIRQEEIRIRRKDGASSWIAVNSSPLRDSEGRITMGISAFVDISEQKDAQKRLHRWNEELEQCIEERTSKVSLQSDMLRALTHQLSRTKQQERLRLAKILHDQVQQLIVAAQLQLDSLRQGIDPEYEPLQETVQSIHAVLQEAIEASRSLAVDLFPPVLHEIGLIAALEWLAERMHAREKFQIHIDAEPDAEPIREETRYMLFECVRELILNVIKHADVREVHLNVRRTEDNNIKLVTRDGGKGFDLGLIEKRSPQDTTFGLYSIQQRLKYIGGQMDIETAIGRGCRIVLTVPDEASTTLPSDSLNGAGAYSELPVEGAAPTAGLLRILVVDDHPLVREGLIGIFKNIPDIEVVGEAADGIQALDLAERLQPDVVLMDYSIGKMNGAQATRKVLERIPHTKVISVSASREDSVVKLMEEAGAAYHFHKSDDVRSLIERIRSLRTDT